MLAGMIIGLPQAARAEVSAADKPYRIAVGDVLGIAVQDHPELSASVTVVSDGTITLPLAGAVPVQGLTVEEIQKTLEDVYDQKFIVNPSISVLLTTTRARQVYVYGEVKVPGVYPLTESLTTLRAIVLAGGFTDYSDKANVKIMRKAAGVDELIKVNVKKIENGDSTQDVPLLPEDVIVVSESYF